MPIKEGNKQYDNGELTVTILSFTNTLKLTTMQFTERANYMLVILLVAIYVSTFKLYLLNSAANKSRFHLASMHLILQRYRKFALGCVRFWVFVELLTFGSFAKDDAKP
uniref:Uncharacterized protein n=1 Tax=Glossina brevipalpis TaxID=37001 RepID=A0A1A9WID7_9MUSC